MTRRFIVGLNLASFGILIVNLILLYVQYKGGYCG